MPVPFPWNGVAVLRHETVDVGELLLYTLDQVADWCRIRRHVRGQEWSTTYYKKVNKLV